MSTHLPGHNDHFDPDIHNPPAPPRLTGVPHGFSAGLVTVHLDGSPSKVVCTRGELHILQDILLDCELLNFIEKAAKHPPADPSKN